MLQKKYCSFFLFLVLLSFVACKKSNTSQTNLVDFIDPFIGTGAHGHTFPGATMPFGMVQLSPDTRLTGWDGCGGYHFTDSIVYGFSHTHLSGTGVSDYGDILLMPTTGTIRLNNGADGNSGYRSLFDKNKEIAQAGYYKTYLEDYQIEVELTASQRAGMHQYHFDDQTKTANIIIDLKHRDKVLNGALHVVNDREIVGVRVSDNWAKEQHIYFAIKFSRAFSPEKIAIDADSLVYGFEFALAEDKKLLAKVGISAVSIEGARKNLEAEMQDWNFDGYRQNAKTAWLEAIKKIEIEGGTEAQKKIFYTAMYHTMIAPNLYQDVDGKYRGMDLKIHESQTHTNYTVFSLWDTYRALHPLFTLIEAERTNDFIRTFIKQYEAGGILPIWELSGNYTGCMIGYHAIPVIADAYKKGIRDYDAAKALKAMQVSAEQDHLGLASYKKLGYIPSTEVAESVSKTLEYAYDDWCIAAMAKAMGKRKIYKKYLKRAQAYKNVFDPSTGFMRAKANNTFIANFDPAEVNYHYTEANAWQYSFYAPQDIKGFYGLMGGKDSLEQKLDQLFSASTETTGRAQADITGLIGQYAHGNEPSHHIAYLYNYVGKPWKTQERVRQIMDELYKAAPDGLSGNEDCGQMSSWLVLSAMGIYPVTPGDNTYVIGTPWFDEVKINLENGKQFSIKANNLTDQNLYIQGTKLNGQIYDKTYLAHQDILAGGVFEFEMGAIPNKEWGSKEANSPISSIDENLIMPLPFVAKGNKSFMEKDTIELGTAISGAAIYYTIDGTKPSVLSTRYTAPIELSNNATIKFFAHSEELGYSKMVEADFFKIPNDRQIELLSTYALQYNAGGNNALIDFQRGSKDFRVSSWQGYEGVDMEAIVDLGKVKRIYAMSLGCLQDQESWIFMPLEVEFFISNDGENFKSVGVVENEIPEKEEGGIIRDFKLKKKCKAQYIKVVAKNRKIVPDWHLGANGKSWIFVDEILLQHKRK